MAVKRHRIVGVALKAETTEGTDSVPTFAANAVRPIGIPVLATSYLDDGDRSDEQHGGMGVIAAGAATGRSAQFDLTLSLKGAGADYSTGVRPEWDVPLRAAGFSATQSGAAGSGLVTYTTLDAGAFETFTAYVITDESKLYKLVGCIAAPKIAAEATKRATISFTIMGRMSADPTESALGAQTLSTVVAPPFVGQSCNIGAFTSAAATPLILRKLDVDFGTATTTRASAGAADGHAGYAITDRKLDCTLELEQVPLATFDPFALSRQAQPGGVDTAVSFAVGGTQFNRVKVTLGQFAFRAPAHGDSSGLGTWTLKGPVLARSIASGAGVGREIAVVAD